MENKNKSEKESVEKWLDNLEKENIKPEEYDFSNE